jgi:hypothetical protein
VQIPLDVTQNTAPQKVLDILRAVLYQFPQQERVGVITHHKHVSLILGQAHSGPKYDEGMQRRLAMVEHFRGGQSRGSNDWLQECDLLLVLGTPRVPPSAVRDDLIRAGLVSAAARSEVETGWADYEWCGTGIGGGTVPVLAKGYRDDDWHDAHAHLVVSELIQAAGRGRSVCADGIPVVVVSTEPLNFPLFDRPFAPLTDSEIEVLRAVDTLAAGELPAPSSDIAEKVGKSQQRVIEVLNDLQRRELVEKIGMRGGWRPRCPDGLGERLTG